MDTQIITASCQFTHMWMVWLIFFFSLGSFGILLYALCDWIFNSPRNDDLEDCEKILKDE